MRLNLNICGWAIAALVVAGALIWHVPDCFQAFLLNAASLAGILLLAIPTIRVNEQGRLIESVRKLQVGILAIQKEIKDRDMNQEVRIRQENTLTQRKQDMDAALNELTTGKGAWTPAVNRTLYGGYVLLLGSAIARLTS